MKPLLQVIFNLDLLKLNENNVISEYFDMLTSNSFILK